MYSVNEDTGPVSRLKEWWRLLFDQGARSATVHPILDTGYVYVVVDEYGEWKEKGVYDKLPSVGSVKWHALTVTQVDSGIVDEKDFVRKWYGLTVPQVDQQPDEPRSKTERLLAFCKRCKEPLTEIGHDWRSPLLTPEGDSNFIYAFGWSETYNGALDTFGDGLIALRDMINGVDNGIVFLYHESMALNGDRVWMDFEMIMSSAIWDQFIATPENSELAKGIIVDHRGSRKGGIPNLIKYWIRDIDECEKAGLL